ncbi:TRAP transporter small permease [Pokkaliibacter sp. MBI-7]|uniref:TRAP transporter small permease n=1 Tax=Pokkaliibacter sp. MBI-7 TaxID=3040600 RepID=UPI0024474714|nr:TRAP transporter small permease [Pokkaliibacter sp. MBI-7]MDH2435341.1 TRAP transporter small permease [Pokkaliibacter sp. MBI-7]
MLYFARLALRLEQFLNLLMAAGLTVMIVLVFINVVLRYGFNSGISITVELSRYLFVWLTFLGAVVALQKNEHLEVGTLVDMLPATLKKLVRIAALLMMLGCALMLMIGAYKQTVLNWSNLSPISEIPIGVFYLAGLVAGVLMSLQLLCRLIGQLLPESLLTQARCREVHP